MNHDIKIKNKACKDYLQGLPLALIAEKHKVPFETIKTWHSTHRWASQKKLKLLGYMLKLWQEGESLAETHIAVSKSIAKHCGKAIKVKIDSENPDLDILLKISSIVNNSSTVANRTIPELDASLLDRVLGAIDESG